MLIIEGLRNRKKNQRKEEKQTKATRFCLCSIETVKHMYCLENI